MDRRSTLPRSSAFEGFEQGPAIVPTAWCDYVHVQVFFLAVCLTYCADILDLVHLGVLDVQGSSLQVDWSWFVGFGVTVFIVAELLSRVKIQGGSIISPNSWARFLAPFTHKVEIGAILFMSFHALLSVITLLVVVRSGSELERISKRGSRRHFIVTCTLLGFRFLRMWNLRGGVSVQRTEFMKMHEKKIWFEDAHAEMQLRSEQFIVKLQHYINGPYVQVFITVLVIFHCGLYVAMRLSEELRFIHWITRPSGYTTLAALSFEFCVRMAAQGSEVYFRPLIHKIQIMFLFTGGCMIAYTTWAYGQGGYHGDAEGIASGIILMFHRLVRQAGIRYKVSGDNFGSRGILDAHMLNIFMKVWADVLEVPPQNVRVKFPLPPTLQGDFEVRVEKARVKPAAFRDLHLPVFVRGALIEKLHLRFPKVAGGQGTIVDVKNLLVLVGPNDGLAEAGGLQPSKPYWEYETIREAKAKLVDLICKRVTPQPPQGGNTKTLKPLGFGAKTFRTAVQATKKKVARFAQQSIEVKVRNVVLQYDDIERKLSTGHVSVGISIGSVSVSRNLGQTSSFEILRLTMHVDPDARTSDHRSKSNLGSLLGMHPQEILEELKRLNNAERWRLWTLHALDRRARQKDGQNSQPCVVKQHQRSERWPERNTVFSLLRAQAAVRPPSAEDFLSQTHWTESLDNVEQSLSWRWRGRSEAVRAAMDDEQARCLQTIASCVNAWALQDEAFRRRPPMRPPTKAFFDSNVHFQSAEMGSITRLWWVYAVHRVLAQLRIRPKMPYHTLMLHSTTMRSYSTLLKDVMQRAQERGDMDLSSVQLRMQLKELGGQEWHDWEFEWAKELQVNLSVGDIVACRKEVLAQCIWGTKRPSTFASERSAVSEFGNSEGRAFGPEGKYYGSEGVYDPSPTSATSQEQEGESSADTAKVELDDKNARNALLTMLEGIWQGSVPYIEVRILRGGPPWKYRELLVHAGVHGMSFDAVIQAPPAPEKKKKRRRREVRMSFFGRPWSPDASENASEISGTAAVEPSYRATLAIGQIKAQCPDAGPLKLGGVASIFNMVGFTEIPRPTEGLLRGTWMGGALSGVLRVATTAAGPYKCELHTADMTCVVYEPLMATLLRFKVADDIKARALEGRSEGLPVRKITSHPPQGEFWAVEGNVHIHSTHVVLVGDKRSQWCVGDKFVIRESSSAVKNLIGPKRISNVELREHKGSRETWLHWNRGREDGSREAKWIFKEACSGASWSLGRGARNWHRVSVEVRSARIGPLRSSSRIPESTDGFTSAARWLHKWAAEVQARTAQQKTRRKLQKFFQLIVGVAGQDHPWDLDLHFGSLHCLQVGHYSAGTVLVEECRVRPGSIKGVRQSSENAAQDAPSWVNEMEPGDAQYRGLVLNCNNYEKGISNSPADWQHMSRASNSGRSPSPRLGAVQSPVKRLPPPRKPPDPCPDSQWFCGSACGRPPQRPQPSATSHVQLCFPDIGEEEHWRSPAAEIYEPVGFSTLRTPSGSRQALPTVEILEPISFSELRSPHGNRQANSREPEIPNGTNVTEMFIEEEIPLPKVLVSAPALLAAERLPKQLPSYLGPCRSQTVEVWPTAEMIVHVVPRHEFGPRWLEKKSREWHQELRSILSPSQLSPTGVGLLRSLE